MNDLAQNIKPESDETAYIQLLTYRKYRRQWNMLNYTVVCYQEYPFWGNRIGQMIQYIRWIAHTKKREKYG